MDRDDKQLTPLHSSPSSAITTPPSSQMSREIMEHAAYLQTTLCNLLPQQDINVTDLSLVEGKLTSVLVSTRALLNSKLLVNKIPPELLADIFEYDQRNNRVYDKSLLDRDNHRNEAPYRSNSKWMRIRLVCRRWRDVADSHASLWTTIDVYWPDTLFTKPVQHQAQEHIKRFLCNSRLAPLHVALNLQGYTPFEAADLLCHAQRIQTLKLVFFDYLQSKFQATFASASAPSLVALELDLRRNTTLGDSTWLPFRIFEGGMPILQSLYIRSGSQPATHGFRNLRQLHLSCLSFQQYTWRALLDVIRNSSLTLEDLVLTQNDEHGPDSEASTLSASRVRLPRLKKLMLSSGWESLTALWISFLRHLDIPSDVFFHCAGVIGDNFPLDHVPCFVQNLLPSVSTVKISADLDYPAQFGRGDVSATGNLFACQISDIDKIELFIQKAKKLFVNTQDLWVEYWVGIDYAQERLWPPIHRLIRLYCASEDAFWLPSLQLRYPFLREIHILKIGQVIESERFRTDIRKLLKLRQKHGLPVEAVYLYLYPKHSSQYNDAWDPWDLGEEEVERIITSVHDRLGAYTRVEVVRGRRVPRVPAPAHCYAQSSGIWKFPTWDEFNY